MQILLDVFFANFLTIKVSKNDENISKIEFFVGRNKKCRFGRIFPYLKIFQSLSANSHFILLIYFPWLRTVYLSYFLKLFFLKNANS